MGKTQSAGKPFDIPKMLIWKAYLKVRDNRGAAGVDGQSLAGFEQELQNNLYKLWNRMASGSYFPTPVKAVPIPKSGGGERVLGVPGVADRIAQTAVTMVLEPGVEPMFHPDSYGYRPRRSALDAVVVGAMSVHTRTMSDIRADDLLYLLELARAGTMVDAASRLGVEHTTVSRRVAALEKSTGRRLVDRTSKSWLLTDDGEELVSHAERIERALHSVEQLAVNQRSSGLGGSVRIAATDGVGGTLVAAALVELRRAHPRLEIELTTATRRFDVASKDYDVAVTLQQTQPQRRFAVQHLTDYILRLYATRHYLETSTPIRCREDLAGHSLVWYVESLLDVPELDIFETEVIDERPTLRSSNIFAQLGFVRAHGGIGLLPQYLVRDDPELEVVLQESIAARRTFWLVARRESLGLARVDATMECLRDFFAAQQDLLVGDPGGSDCEVPRPSH